jgi:transcriptional regulator with XRE-family HTH domain
MMTRRLSGMIKQRRTELGLSQRALAKLVGVSDAYITQLETRERINPSLQVLKKLAKALRVSVTELVK